MFQLQLFDIEGTPLNLGDWIEVSCSTFGQHTSTFYVRLGLTDNNRLVPHDTFSWRILRKVNADDIPADAVKADGDKYTNGEYYHKSLIGKDFTEQQIKDHRMSFITGIGHYLERGYAIIQR